MADQHFLVGLGSILLGRLDEGGQKIQVVIEVKFVVETESGVVLGELLGLWVRGELPRDLWQRRMSKFLE